MRAGGPRAAAPPTTLISGRSPVCPARTVLDRGGGSASVAVRVSADGPSAQIRVVEVPGRALCDPAAPAVHGWRSSPAARDGHPLASRFQAIQHGRANRGCGPLHRD